MPNSNNNNILLVGISGPSSSGKTTLARLLRDIFPKVFILHEDDFYKPDAEMPIHSTAKVADWDCIESLNLPALNETLIYIKRHGMSPPSFTSKEDRNSVGKVEYDESTIGELKRKASRVWGGQDVPSICVLDGFLLFSEEMADLRGLFDVRMFLRTDYETAKARREARTGYVTLEGFWEDPPGYVDVVVWPNYVKDHAFLFKDGDVDGELDEAVLEKLGIEAMPREAQGNMTACVQWAYGVIEKALVERVERGSFGAAI